MFPGLSEMETARISNQIAKNPLKVTLNFKKHVVPDELNIYNSLVVNCFQTNYRHLNER